MSILELSNLQVMLLAILLPMVSIGLSILFYLLTKKETNNTVRKYMAYLIHPIPIKPLTSENSSKQGGEYRSFLKTQIGLRLVLVYLAIVLFIVSNIIGEFYQTVSDLTIELQQSGGTFRKWSQLVIETPFSSGWDGSLPWGPIPGMAIRYRTWNWIFFTGGITDNPGFLGAAINTLIIRTVLFGIVFLVPLLIPAIRKSFIPSLFFFTTGMATITKAFFGCFSQAWQLQFGNIELQYGFLTVTQGQLNGPSELTIITVLIPIIITIYVLILFIGRKLWQGYYLEHQGTHRWLIGYVSVSYWLSLVFVLFG